jgi:hypothetical protein
LKPKWWTCACGKAQMTVAAGTPVCEACGKPAPFTREAPRGQGGFDFGAAERVDDERNGGSDEAHRMF